MAKLTADQRRQARNLLRISRYNAGSTKQQLQRQMWRYDTADEQNRMLADMQMDQNAEQSDADRFAQAQKLQSSAKGLFAESGNAMQGSQLGAVGNMLGRRNAQDSADSLTTLGANQQTVLNSLDESLNANVLARKEAADNAAFQLRNLESDLSAQLNTISPKLFRKPGRGRTNLGSKAMADRFSKIQQNTPSRAGYFVPDADVSRSGY